jgi:transcriptional regulator with XRE-family HTH domain
MDTLVSRREDPKEDLKKELGARVIEARKRRGWKQAELARRLRVPRERLGSWERGRRAPRMEDLVLLSEVLEIPFELGLGRRVEEEEELSAVELTELARHLAAMARLLKPWMARRQAVGGAAPANGK